jgi:large subunit ribosomal protein L25
MANDLRLEAATRTESGRHVKALRRGGHVPAVLYGHRVEPRALSLEVRALERVWHRAGRSHLVDLALDGGKARKVLIREFQVDPRSTRPLHVDFFAVNLREKLAVDVPLVAVGESPAVSEQKVGVLQQLLNTVRIECLPGDIPAQLTVDITPLEEIDQGIHLRDVPLPEGVTLAHGIDQDELVVKVAAVRVTAETEEEEAAAAEDPAEAPADAGDEGSAE